MIHGLMKCTLWCKTFMNVTQSWDDEVHTKMIEIHEFPMKCFMWWWSALIMMYVSHSWIILEMLCDTGLYITGTQGMVPLDEFFSMRSVCVCVCVFRLLLIYCTVYSVHSCIRSHIEPPLYETHHITSPPLSPLSIGGHNIPSTGGHYIPSTGGHYIASTGGHYIASTGGHYIALGISIENYSIRYASQYGLFFF